jgi:putative ABC transport system substrate-binding protein
VLIGTVETDPEAQARIVAFKGGLQALGWTDGRNVHIDYRFGSADPVLTHKYAAELVDLAPDAILANSPLVSRALRYPVTLGSSGRPAIASATRRFDREYVAPFQLRDVRAG